MTMREKMARAIHDTVPRHFPRDVAVRPWEDEPPRVREPLLAVADAVLDALLEPTEGMIEFGIDAAKTAADHYERISSSAIKTAFQAMIQAAKDGK